MKAHRATAVVITLLVLTGHAWAETPPEADADATGGTTDEQLLSPKLLLLRVATDQKHIWMFPVRAAKGNRWKPALAVIGVTAGLVALDPTDTPLFQKVSYQQNPVVHGINHVLSGTDTGLLMAAVPISFYVVGLVHKDSYASNSALLAGEAVVNAEIVAIAMKDITRRLTPGEVGPNGDFSDSWFRSTNRSPGGLTAFLPVTPSRHFPWRRYSPNAIDTTAGHPGSPTDWPAW